MDQPIARMLAAMVAANVGTQARPTAPSASSAPSTPSTSSFRDGAFVRLVHVGGYDSGIVFRIKHMPQGMYCFEVAPTFNRTLRIGPDGTVDLHGMYGPWAQFDVTLVSGDGGDSVIMLQSVGNRGKTNRTGSAGWHLAFNAKTQQPEGVGPPDASAHWRVVPVSQEEVTRQIALGTDADRPPLWDDRASLSHDELLFFRDNGYLQVRDIVPRALVDAALRIINMELGRVGGGMQRNQLGHPVLGGGVGASAAVVHLLTQTPLFTLAQRLLGRAKCSVPREGQVALVFPRDGTPPPEHPRSQWHIDGLETGSYSPFTMLIGVSLSDQMTEFAGNFTVFPGSHTILQARCKANMERKSDQHDLINSNPLAAALIDRPDVGPARQLLARAGDAVFAHQKLAHSAGMNFSPNIR